MPPILDWAHERKAFWSRTGFKPNPGVQAKAANCKARFVTIAAGTRFGKSRFAAEMACPVLCRPGKNVWIVAPTYELGVKEFGYIQNKLVDELRLPTVKNIFNADQGKMHLAFPWGSWVKVKSAKHPDSLQAEELDFLIVAEGAGMKRWIYERYLRGRLTTRRGHALYISTPKGANYFKTLFDRGMTKKWRDKGWMSFQAPTWENPYNLETEDEVKDELTEHTYREIYLAEFMSHVGLVFRDEWNHDENVISQEEAEKLYAKAHRRIGVVDWGYTNPVVLNPLGIHPEYIVQPAEWYERHKTIDQIIDQGLKMQRKWNIEGWICDPEEPGYIKMFTDHGLRAIAGNNAVIPGLDCARRHMKRRNPEGRRGFMVSENCTNTIWEIEEGYRYPEKKEEAIAGGDKPIDANNHACSADRYGVYTLEAGPKSVGTVQRVVVSDVERVRIGEGEF